MGKTVLFVDRFDDPNLAEWTKDVGGSNSITQVSEQKSVGLVAYTETRVDFNVSDTSNPCQMYKKFSQSLDKISVLVDVLTPDTAPSGDQRQFMYLATQVTGIAGSLVFKIDDSGKIIILYKNTSGSSTSVTSTDTYNNRRVQILIYADVSNHYVKIVLNNNEVIEITDFTISGGTGKFDYIVFGTPSAGSTYTFSVYGVVVADYIPSPKYTVNGYNVPYSLGASFSRIGVYTVPYADASGNCYVQVRSVDDDSLIKTIDLGETVDPSDKGHEFVATRFVKEPGGNVYLYVIVGRHGAQGTLVKIDTSNWTILWKTSVSAGTYPSIVVYKKYIGVVQREGTSYPEHLYMHVFDPSDGSPVQSVKIVNAGSDIVVYPMTAVHVSSDGRYIAVGWTYYDSSTKKRYNTYMLVYDAQLDKWYAWNGVEKTLPVEYNDNDCLISDNHQTLSAHWRNNKLYVLIGGAYDPQYVKLYEWDPATKTASEIYDGASDNLTAVLVMRFIYDVNGGFIAWLIADFDQYQNVRLVYNYYATSDDATFLDLENRLLIMQNIANNIEVYEISYTSTDSPNAETALYLSAKFVITQYPSSISSSPNEQRTINITVENQGDVEGTVELRIKDHNGNIVASQQQSIPAGKSYTFSMSITLPSTAGNYTWSIEAYNVSTSNVDDSKSFTVEVSGFSWEQLLQMFMQWLPWILMIMFIVLMVSLLTAALR